MLLTPTYSRLFIGDAIREILAEEGRLEGGEAITMEKINGDNTDTNTQSDLIEECT